MLSRSWAEGLPSPDRRRVTAWLGNGRLRRLAVAAMAGMWLWAVVCPAQDPPKSIWPTVGENHWFWITPRIDLSPAEVDAVLKRMVGEQTGYVDSKFPVTVFFAKKARLTAGKSGKRKGYGDQPGKADDLRIEAEWRTGYLNHYRGSTYTFIALDTIRGIDLHYLPDPRQRFPKTPEGRNWNVNILAGSLYSFFFWTEETARAFIDAVTSSLNQRGLNLTFSRFGLMWENVNAAQAADMGRQAGEGVLITQVAVGGPGDHAGIRPLDAVLEVNGVTVKNFSHFSVLLEGIPPGTKASLLVQRRLKPPDRFPEPAPWEPLTLELEAR